MSEGSEVSVTGDATVAPGEEVTLRYEPGTDRRVLSLVNVLATSQGTGTNSPPDMDVALEVERGDDAKPINRNMTVEESGASSSGINSTGGFTSGPYFTTLQDNVTRRIPTTVVTEPKQALVVTLRHSERSGAAESYDVSIGIGAATTIEVAR